MDLISPETLRSAAHAYISDHGHTPTASEALRAGLTGKKILIDIYAIGKKTYVKNIEISDSEEKIIRANGYLSGQQFLSGWKYLLISKKNVFVRIHTFRPYDIRRDGNFQTSSTLYDYMMSTTERDFIKNLIKIKMDPMDVKRVGLIVVAIAVGIGSYFLLFGGL